MRFLILFISLFIIVGCSNKMKEKIGLTTTGPNEYELERKKPLELPPHYNLPDPESLK